MPGNPPSTTDSTSSTSAGRSRKARHLIDFDAPPKPPDPNAAARLQRVQHWVMSVLAVSVALHLAIGCIIAAMTLDDATRTAEIGLNVMAGVFSIIGVALGLAIHGRRVLSPWLLLGVLPALAGVWLTLR